MQQIAAKSEYSRTVAETLLDQLWRTFQAFVDRLLQTVVGTPTSRRISLAVIGAVALLLLVRAFLDDRETRALTRRRQSIARTLQGDAWPAAQRFAALGQYTDAAHALCVAVLDACAARGELRLHPSKTTGDYARELRRGNAPAHTPFQGFRRRYDRLVYGKAECTADDYHALLTDASPMLGLSRAA